MRWAGRRQRPHGRRSVGQGGLGKRRADSDGFEQPPASGFAGRRDTALNFRQAEGQVHDDAHERGTPDRQRAFRADGIRPSARRQHPACRTGRPIRSGAGGSRASEGDPPERSSRALGPGPYLPARRPHRVSLGKGKDHLAQAAAADHRRLFPALHRDLADLHATDRASRVAAVSLLRTCHRQCPGGTNRCSRRSLPSRWQPSALPFSRSDQRSPPVVDCTPAEPPEAALFHRNDSVRAVASSNRSDRYRLERQLPGGFRAPQGNSALPRRTSKMSHAWARAESRCIRAMACRLESPTRKGSTCICVSRALTNTLLCHSGSSQSPSAHSPVSCSRRWRAYPRIALSCQQCSFVLA